MKKTLIAVILILAASAAGWLLLSKQAVLSGYTMGSTYRVVIRAPGLSQAKLHEVQQRLDQRFAALNRVLSLYDPESELSRLNAATVNIWIPVSKELGSALTLGKKLYDLSGGAWDGSVLPLVDLWGFYREVQDWQPPTFITVQNTIGQVGYDRLVIAGDRVMKQQPVRIDLASIGQGIAVDEATIILRSLGYKHFTIEVGGEVYASGTAGFRRPWKIGLAWPEQAQKRLAVVLRLHDKGAATSGDYQKFHEWRGQKYSHILDPRTGYPIEHKITSVTVIASTAAMADGLATVLMVLGDDGRKLLESQKGCSAVILRRTEHSFKVETWGEAGLWNKPN